MLHVNVWNCVNDEEIVLLVVGKFITWYCCVIIISRYRSRELPQIFLYFALYVIMRKDIRNFHGEQCCSICASWNLHLRFFDVGLLRLIIPPSRFILFSNREEGLARELEMIRDSSRAQALLGPGRRTVGFRSTVYVVRNGRKDGRFPTRRRRNK